MASWWRRVLGGGAFAATGDGGASRPALHAEMQQRLTMVQGLLDAAQAAANVEAQVSTSSILDGMILGIKTAFEAQHACIHFVQAGALSDETNGSGMQACPVGLAPHDESPVMASIEKAAMDRALALGRPMKIAAARGEVQGLGSLAQLASFEDGIVLPIAYQGDAFAVVNVYVPQRREFDEMDTALLRTLGGVLYGAIKKEAFIGALRRIRATLETHFSPRVVDKLISDPESFASQKSERLEVSVLFSDIRGFTALSERLDPDEVASMVSEHLEAMADVVFRHGGIVDKYIGDSVMAVFGSPFPQDDHPQRAIAAAMAMVDAQHEIQQRWGVRLDDQLAIGIGINTGVAIVGDVGRSRREFTHLGDTVNLASRLKDVAKPWQVLVNQSTYERARDQIDALPVEPFQVKGKREAVTAFEVRAYTGPTASLLDGERGESA